MTNLKKMMAALTAAMCMTAMMPVPVIAGGTAVLDHDSYVVIAVNYAEGTDEAESYVLLNTPQWQYVITAEDMECYLTEDSAQPKIGDVLKVECDEGDNLSGKGMYDILFGFVFSEGDTITNYGSADEYLSDPINYVLLREYEGQYLLQDVQSGDKVTYREPSASEYTTPYNMDEAAIGDTVSFYHGGYDTPVLPITVTKGDGTIPELPEAVIDEEYQTSPAIIIGAVYDYGSAIPSSYLVSKNGVDAELWTNTLFAHMNEFAHPECGDVLMVDYTAMAESSPEQFCIPQNGLITNAGKAEDLYGTKSFTVTENTGYQLVLEDADGNSKRWSYSRKEEGYILYHSEVSDAQAGDVLTFILDENGRPILPVSETKCEAPVTQAAVIGVDDAENPQNYIIYSLDKDTTNYILSAEMLEECLAEGEEKPEFGDILELTGFILQHDKAIYRSNEFNLQIAEEIFGTDANDGIIRNIGSVFDSGETIEMQSALLNKFNYYTYKLEYTDRNGGINYPCDFLKDYVQPGCVDLRTLYKGDMVTMVAYNGIPVFPSASASVLGDVNGDNALDILDVIALNKSLLAGAELPALSGARSGDLGHCDFNGNGTLDMDDSLGMMKRILRIES